jgi:hypothetical protein
MSDTITDKKRAWLAQVLGIQQQAPDGGAPSATAESFISMADVKYAATEVKRVAGNALTEAGIGAETVEQGGRRAGAAALEKGGEVVTGILNRVGWGTPATATAVGPVTMTSQTEALTPAPRTRLKLGVGERVTLNVTGGAANWTITGGTLSAKTGTTVTMTAPVRPGTVQVTADVGGTTASLTFNVVAPSSVYFHRVQTEHYNGIPPNAGFRADLYLGPDDVNFGEASFIEDEIYAKGTGSWKDKNGEGHSPNKSPLPCTDTVVAGRGTATGARDHCWSGYVPGLVLTDWTGQASWEIPWHWRCSTGAGMIGRYTQLVDTDAAGRTTITKGNASFAADLS